MSTLSRLWPRAKPDLIRTIEDQAPALFKKYGLTTKLRVAHFMAQISHESNGGTITEENLYYTHAERIVTVWPRRFNVEQAMEYVGQPQELACKVYNGRMGNAEGSNDGWTYRGRGLLQITGKEAYEHVGQACGIDLVGHPELAYGADALEVALYEFAKKLGCLPFCDANDLRTVTLHVNGGYNGLQSRGVWLARWMKALDKSLLLGYEEPVQPMQGVMGLMSNTAPTAPAHQSAPSWIVQRLREPSTYAGLSILLGFLGPIIHVNGQALAPELQNLGMAVGAILAIVLPELK